MWFLNVHTIVQNLYNMAAQVASNHCQHTVLTTHSYWVLVSQFCRLSHCQHQHHDQLPSLSPYTLKIC